MEIESKEEFFDRSGGVGLIFELGKGAMSFTELEQNLDISSSTLSRRLKEGKELDLWEEKLVENPQTGRSNRKYFISDRGEELFDQLQEVGLPEVIVKLRKYKQEYNTKVSKLRESV